MGEIAEMMLDGTLCEGCGEFIGEGPGHPRLCRSCCGAQPKAEAVKLATKKVKPKMKCQLCGRMVKVTGIANHLRDAHGWNE